MHSLNEQILTGISELLLSRPIHFIFDHSLAIGIITGIISLMPFVIKQIPHMVVIIIALLASYHISESFNLTFEQALHDKHFYIVISLIGDYIIGCIFGAGIANLIQSIRGEENHAASK